MKITGLILAGGLGRRMGGRDKGLQPFRGKPMAAWAIERLAPQVDALLINANQNLEAYAAFGYPVVPDRIAGFAGPLAGLHTGLLACETPLLVTAPAIRPSCPRTWWRACATPCVCRHCRGKTEDQPHPYSPWCAEVGRPDGLSKAAAARSIWYAALKVAEVPFADERAFANINTLEELNLLES
jgi:molybdopterin-guanine dinucleotide biosynthesis protein A